MLYIFNTIIIPSDSNIIVSKVKLTLAQVKEYLKPFQSEEIVSAVGHQSTADLLSQLLALEISCQRIAVNLVDRDIVIAFALKNRLPEGKILSAEELARLEYDFWIMRVYDANNFDIYRIGYSPNY